VYKIGRGESRQGNRDPSTVRPGSLRVLTERRFYRLVTEVKRKNPPAQGVLGNNFKIFKRLMKVFNWK